MHSFSLIHPLSPGLPYGRENYVFVTAAYIEKKQKKSNFLKQEGSLHIDEKQKTQSFFFIRPYIKLNNYGCIFFTESSSQRSSPEKMPGFRTLVDRTSLLKRMIIFLTFIPTHLTNLSKYY